MTANLPSPDLALSDAVSQPDDQSLFIPKTSAAIQPSNTLKQSDSASGHQMTAPETFAGKVDRNSIDAKTKIFSLLKEKAQEWKAVTERKGPLRLLDLPMDVLKEIVKEVTHTNDLTALALTHSALHNLAIPHIYSRFDIVWPDAHATADPRTGVDALTYGLATLCMGEVFTDHEKQSFMCTNCGASNTAGCNHSLGLGLRNGQRRLGNQYPQFTRKFSLGNGPVDWVQEYLITKESGKMLGTLVALAVARMINLETFVWDMPTGVLRDVWLALSSLQTRSPSQVCRLERVWVRWHDNSDSSVAQAQSSNAPSGSATAGSTLTSIGWNIPSGSVPQIHISSQPLAYSQGRVEYPTLSVLPPLKSLSVLDIDELDYLDEMSILIAKSKDPLRELRVGISGKAVTRDFAIAWDGPDLHQVDHKAVWPGASTIGDRRLGGVLGVLLGRVFDIRRKQKTKIANESVGIHLPTPTQILQESQPLESHITMPIDIQNSDALQEYIPETSAANVVMESDWSLKQQESSISEGTILNPGVTFNIDSGLPLNEATTFNSNVSKPLVNTGHVASQSDMESLTALISGHDTTSSTEGITTDNLSQESCVEAPLRRLQLRSQELSESLKTPCEREKLEGKLRLQTLELERVPLSVIVLQKAFDWSVLTNLTILDCPQHDRLWLMLRRHFQPSAIGSGGSSGKHAGGPMQYHLNLRKIHTDAASTSLISFLKETLAPNTLEVLFLQDRRRSSSTNVTIDAIYRGPLKRHRASLKKLMLDSSDRIPRGPTNTSDNTRWRTWMPNRDVLNFITSGRMSALRELSIAIDYKDWHHFLQRLPQIPHLRSLNIPYIADHATPAFDPKELALQVVDVIVLRPEVELCYMGVSHKCFEILENRPHDDGHGSADTHSSLATGAPGGNFTDDEDGSDADSDDDEEEQEEEDNGAASAAQIDPDETESEISDHDDDDSDTDSYDGSEDGRSKIRLRLREILFYDDKVAIFKARHGRL